MRKYVAEFLGTFFLVFVGTGAVVYSAASTSNPLMIALAFGLAVVAGAYAFGEISGAHFNPAVSLAMAIAKRLSWTDFIGYVFAQLLGAIVASAAVYAGVAAYLKSSTVVTALNGTKMSVSQFITTAGLGQTNYSTGSDGYAFAIEALLTFSFVLVILLVTTKTNQPVAPLAIGLWLAALITVGFSITGSSLNPARSLAPALFAQGTALTHVWVYLLAPLVGGALAALVAKYLDADGATDDVEEIKEAIKASK